MKCSTFLIAFLLTVLPLCGSFAEDIPVKIKAEDLKYDQAAGIIVAKDSVKVYFKQVELHSDRAVIDLNANVATLEGNVEIITKDYFATSNLVTYDISAEVTVIFNIKSVITAPEVKGKIYLTSQTLNDYVDNQKGSESSVTTCDYGDPHYHVRSKWFEYYPDEFLVGFSNTFYAGSVPMMWTPVYIFNLMKYRNPYNFVYGQNEVEGRFLRTQFDYFFSKSQNGAFKLDITEKKGTGFGIEHDYVLDAANAGVLYLYKIDELDTGLKDSIVSIKHNIKLDDYSRLSVSHHNSNIYRVPSGRLDETGGSLAYNFDDGKRTLGLNMGFLENRYSLSHSESLGINRSEGDSRSSFSHDRTQRTAIPKWDRLKERFFHEQNFLSPDAKISFDINYSKYATDEGVVADEKMESRIDLSYKGSFYALKLVQSWYVDVDGSLYTGDENYEYLERLPELTVSLNPVILGGFTFNLGGGIARYHEAKYIQSLTMMRHMTANRYYFGGSMNRTDDIGLGTSLRQSYGLDQFLYEPGDARYQFREAVGAETNLWGFFRNNIDHSRAISEGNTPFFFDNIGSNYNNIKEKITLYYLDKVVFTVDGGYNYYTKQHFDNVANLLVVPNEKFRMTMSGGYSIEGKRYRDLSASVTFIPFPRFTNTGGLVYDLNNGKLVSANSLVDLEMGESWESRWHFKMGQTYDFFSSRYILRDLAIVKDLHCWELSYTYTEYLREHRIGMTLKAFPNMPVGFATGGQGSYFEGFWENLHF